ncbi:MAG: EAL domain-containing protein, partial [Myxococcota bacterium]
MTAHGLKRHRGRGADTLAPILVVDDDPCVLRSVKRSLRKRFAVMTASTGRRAVELVQRHLFSAVILDLHLPDLDGLHLLETLIGVQPELVAVVLTGAPEIDLRRQTMKPTPIVQVLSKPWDPYALEGAVERALALRTRRRRRPRRPDGAPRVLLLEDDEDDALLTQRRLRKLGWQVHHCVSITAAMGAGRSFDALILDLSLPDGSGLDSVLRLQSVYPGAAVLVRSGHRDAALAGEAVRAGAQDYLTKGDEDERLGRALELALERASHRSHLSSLAYRDQLTGLANRLLFRDTIRRCLGRSAENGSSVGVVYVDLDRFKVVNDSLGHEAGDQLLQRVAERLSGCVRQMDMVARLGGDEFAAVLASPATPREVEKVAQRMRTAFQDSFLLVGQRVVCTASIGTAFARGGNGIQVDDLLRDADSAMYRAKRGGRNQVRACAASLHGAADKRLVDQLALEHELRETVKKRGFELFFQPQFGLKPARTILSGYEALLRWQRASGEHVAPSVFVPLLEEMGLITEVTSLVLEESAAQHRRWLSAGLDPEVRMCVNVSARDFEEGTLVERVLGVLAEAKLRPAQFELEITEGTLMADGGASAGQLDELRARGVSVAVDDFGTGYSSLAYLQQLPVSRLKVDRVFLKGMMDSPERSITESVIRLGQRLGLEVLAEGVETEEQLVLLNQFGCDHVQGFYLGRPGVGWGGTTAELA